MAAYTNDSAFFTRRGIFAVVVVAMHLLLAWGLANGLARKIVETFAPPIEADIVEEVKPDDQPPPPPPPEMERPPVEVPPPEVAIDLPMETNTTAIQDVSDKPPPPAPPPRPPIAGTTAKITRNIDPNAFYPPGSIRRDEQGSPVLQACVGPNGRLLREPVVTDTSGFPDLDAASVKLAKAMRFAAGTENGSPVAESCVKFKVKFILKAN
jgi:periplasmic protein TonB